jgi:hypothetical protein
MRKIILFFSGMLVVAAGCATTRQEKAVTIVNAGAVSPDLLERVRAFAEKELRVPVRSEDNLSLSEMKDFQALEKAAAKAKDPDDVTYIVLAELNGDGHLKVYPENGVGLVNAQPLRTDDAEKFARRIERMVMRAAAFCFGLPPTPDPYCVTRDYRSLEDLDRMGCNYSPPWQARYAKEAAARGLEPPEAPVKPPFATQ